MAYILAPMDTLASLLRKVAGRTGPDLGVRLRLRGRWAAVAGPALAARSHLVLEGRRVTLEVDDARWAAQVEELRDVVQARLEAEAGKLEPFAVRVVKRAAAPPEPPIPRVRTVALGAELDQALGRIRDEGLRAKLRALALESAARGSARS